MSSTTCWIAVCCYWKVALLGKVHEARSPQELLNLVQLCLGFIDFWAWNDLLEGNVLIWLMFFVQINWNHHLEFKNDHILLFIFDVFLKLFRDLFRIQISQDIQAEVQMEPESCRGTEVESITSFSGYLVTELGPRPRWLDLLLHSRNVFFLLGEGKNWCRTDKFNRMELSRAKSSIWF